jgi:lipoate-protein ligase A
VGPLTPAPSAHALSLAGGDLPERTPPLLRVAAAREVVVVLPRSRDPRREVFLERCRDDGVPVVLRPSGGGAVVLSPGVVAASALLELPVSDLCVGERKIAGSSLRLWRSRALYQVSVLVDADVEVMERYLRHPSREPAYRAGRRHRDFVASVSDLVPGISPAAVVDALTSALVRAAGGALHALAPPV